MKADGLTKPMGPQSWRHAIAMLHKTEHVDPAVEENVRLNTFKIADVLDEGSMKFLANVLAGVIKQGLDGLPCPPCPSAPPAVVPEPEVSDPGSSWSTLTHGLVALASAGVGLYVGNVCHSHKVEVADSGQQSPCSYTMTGDRFSFLGQNRVDRHQEASRPYQIERNKLCCKRRKG